MTFMQLGQEFMRTKLVATGPDGEITPLDRERAMNSTMLRFCESGPTGIWSVRTRNQLPISEV